MKESITQSDVISSSVDPKHRRLEWPVILAIGGLHLGCLAAPWTFSWSGLALVVVFWWLGVGLGITMGYHRLLTHRSFRTPKPVEYLLTILGTINCQGGPIRWVGTHRLHHCHADQSADPHSPRHGFTWSHMFWCMYYDGDGFHPKDAAKDLGRNAVYVWLDRYFYIPQLVLTICLFAIAWALGGPWLALSWVVWGICVRTVLGYHATWLVNSAGHTWGYRNFSTRDGSRNTWWIALLTFGEGWHNNHHAQQRSAAHGMRWFELDLTYCTIRLMERIGLASHVVRPVRPVRPVRIAPILHSSARRRIHDQRSQRETVAHVTADGDRALNTRLSAIDSGRSTVITSVSAFAIVSAVTLGACTCVQARHQESAPIQSAQGPELPAPVAAAHDPAGTSSVMVYLKVVLEKDYGLVAQVLGGERDSTWRRTAYDPDRSWWENPLVAYSDPPLPDADVIGGADAYPITGSGTSSNVTVQVTLIPHADVAVKTQPATNCISGTITTTISSLAEYYDGRWTQLVDESDRLVTFSFDTRDPNRRIEEIGRKTRTISAFALERYTRDDEKWEPKRTWPTKARSGDWRVVIYGNNAVMHVTHYRYLGD